VAFTDPDCVPRADWLEQIHRAMANPQISLVLGNRRFATDTGTLGMLAAYESALGARTFESGQPDCYYAYTNNMAVRRSVLDALGGFERRLRGADTLLMRRVAAEYGGSAVKYSPDILVRHLEIASISDYLLKKTIYGQVNRNRETGSRPLSLTTRLELARRTVHESRGSLADKVVFWGVLAIGALRFEWERSRDLR
jgi:hypothetical protein